MEEPVKPIPGKSAAPPKPAPPQPSSQHELREKRGDDKPVMIQRKCACDTGKCGDCGEKKPVQRKGNGPMPDVPPSVTEPMEQSAGQPLPIDLRKQMQARFGHEFERVQVHTDMHAGKAARSANARAFTSGDEIFFAEGEYRPDTEAGRELIAHELAHVVQQRGGAAGTVAKKGAGELKDDRDDPLEREADRAAMAVLKGQAPSIAGASSGGIHRKKKKAPPQIPGVIDLPETAPLTVPGEKDEVTTEYEAALADFRLHTLGKFSRPGTSTLRGIWKDKSRVDFPETYKPDAENVCEVDHIIELQIGGTNNSENLQLLEKSNNASSGSQIKSQLEKFVNAHGEKIRFSKLSYTKKVNDRCRKKEQKISKEGQTGITLIFGGRSVTVDLSKMKSLGNDQYDFSGRRGQIAAGMAFEKLTYSEDDKGPLKGSRITGKLTGAMKTYKKDRVGAIALDIGRDAVVKLPKELEHLKLAFPYLSEADFEASIDDQGFAGKGRFNPTLPLINKSEVTIGVGGGKFLASVKVDAGQVTLPIPGVVVTESTLEATIDDDGFHAKGKLAFKIGTIADAVLKARAGKTGFEATGTIDFHVPGLDKVQGELTYREGTLTGKITLGKDKFKLPGIKAATLVIDVTDTAVTGTGDIELKTPAVKRGTLAFAFDKGGNFAITGTAAISVPGLKDGEVALTYADGDISGVAKLSLAIPGLESATFEIRYAKGLFTGKGELAFRKGKLAGSPHAELTEKQKVKGGGELGYEIVPGVLALVGVEILEDGTTKISGEVRVPETIPIFDVKPFMKNLFGFSVQIPIFAIPVGSKSVGLVAEIGSRVTALAGIGPGQIRGVKAKATLDLAKDDSLEFEAAAELYIPAFAELRLSVYGGVGLSLAIASATGGIELAASLGLQGALSTAVQIQYAQGRFVLDAVAQITAQPALKFDVNAYVKVEVDLLLTTIEVYRQDWKLASKEWGGGITVGLRFPVHYESNKPFQLSLDQLEFIKPDIDVGKAIKDLLPI